MRRFRRKCATDVAFRVRSFPAHSNFRALKKSQFVSRRNTGGKAAELVANPASSQPANMWHGRCIYQDGRNDMIDVILTLAIVVTAALILIGSSWRDEYGR